ncbi:MAG: adenosine deaminase, partial [Acidimicrobiia bacterium]
MTGVDLSSLPKVLLHDHLDGGLRVDTVIDIAAESGYDALPTTTPNELADWFYQGAAGSLEQYLEAFRHTVGVMQSEAALRRVAYEAVLDLADDGVVYAEIRLAPSLHLTDGLRREQVIEAVLEGLSEGSKKTEIVVGLILDAM